VVLELTSKGEFLVREGTLERHLRRHLGVDEDHPIFIPLHTYKKGGREIQLEGIQGYVFIASGLMDYTYFSLENQDYTRSILSISNDKYRTITTLPDSSVQHIRDKIRDEISTDLEEGMFIRVILGDYIALEGEIIGFDGEKALVEVGMRSIHAIVPIPRICCDPIKE
jgi:transcription antitermination factor NusG